MPRLSRSHQEAWSALFVTQARIQLEVDRALEEAGLPPHTWYDLLYRLHLADGKRMRMHELADEVAMSRSGLTRLADRLEEAGLVTRRQCPTDRRGLELELLPAGTEMLRRIWAVYGEVLARTFGAHVGDPGAITEQLRPVLEAVGARAVGRA
ncbi:MAG: MarR family transcriptional regulator [Actinobacteria bacterium]|nr:MarR family transcriptional regulator [Actinomycetota bacterium]